MKSPAPPTPFFSESRHLVILNILAEKKSIRVGELSELLGTSASTVRRDLAELSRQELILRTHGGAIVLQSSVEPPVLTRMSEHAEEKKNIGRAAAQLVEKGDTIYISSGTTALEVARHLPQEQELTVITNALIVLNELASRQDITLVAIGGLVRQSELSMLGHIAEQALQQLHAQKVFIGIRMISLEDGLTSDHLPEVMTDRAIIDIGEEVILVADHSKFGKTSKALVAPITALSKVVTDRGVDQAMVEKLRRMGIEVIIV